MKSSNLALRIPEIELSPEPPPARPPAVAPIEPARVERPPPRFERRTIEIRDQGFAPFRVR